MWKALLSKELRECGLYAGLALVAEIHWIGAGMGLPLIPYLGGTNDYAIPFIPYYYRDNREVNFVIIGVLAAVVLGFHQTMWESWRQTALFLLHRPMSRPRIFAAKMVAGSSLVLVIMGIPLLVYCLWAAAPGTHASPFYWGMSEPWWRGVIVAVACYFGALLTGLRPANWIGSKAWPLAAAIVMAVGLGMIPGRWAPCAYVGLIALMAGLIVSILDVVRTREFP